MTARLFLRTGEVPALFGLDANKSEWALWNALRSGEDGGAGDYGKWQSRLMVPIMQGIAEDHGIKIGAHLDPHSTKCEAIMPPRCWQVAPSMLSDGRPALLVVSQRTESSLREWKEPGLIPNRSLMRYRAIAAAHEVADVLVGVLVDGYSSRLFHVHADDATRTEIRRRAEEFVADVRDGIEPDIDFGSDERAIRSGQAVARAEASKESVDCLLDEKAKLVMERAPVDAQIKRIDTRMRQIDTHLIHMAGKTGRLDAGNRLVVVERDGKGVAKVTVIDKAPAPLF